MTLVPVLEVGWELKLHTTLTYPGGQSRTHFISWLICKFDGFLSLWPVARFWSFCLLMFLYYYAVPFPHKKKHTHTYTDIYLFLAECMLCVCFWCTCIYCCCIFMMATDTRRLFIVLFLAFLGFLLPVTLFSHFGIYLYSFPVFTVALSAHL